MPSGRFSFPTLIHFGPGVRAKVAGFLKDKGLQRPLLVSDKGLAALPVFTEVFQSLKTGGLEPGTFSGIWGNPTKTQVAAGVEAYRAHRADCLVGLGGGAALDVSKAIALMVNHPGDLFDYEDEKPGALPFKYEIPFWVALPTTSGTGSEVGRSSVISDDQTHLKKIIFDPKLLARAVFADPELTLGLPGPVTAATGMDALTHCVEAYLAKDYHPICDGVALEGLRLASQSLAQCVEKPGDIEARGSMMMASMMGAIAFQKGLGLVHSSAHALSTFKDLHHGLANGIMIDHALPFNVSAVPERFRSLAQAAGLKDESPEAFITWLTSLKKRIGIPAGLSEKGIQAGDVKRLSELAFQDSCHLNNPRPCTQADFEVIFLKAIKAL
jgi:alcohol dehydrogenase class IV